MYGVFLSFLTFVFLAFMFLNCVFLPCTLLAITFSFLTRIHFYLYVSKYYIFHLDAIITFLRMITIKKLSLLPGHCREMLTLKSFGWYNSVIFIVVFLLLKYINVYNSVIITFKTYIKYYNSVNSLLLQLYHLFLIVIATIYLFYILIITIVSIIVAEETRGELRDINYLRCYYFIYCIYVQFQYA